ncbi:hypothetical protein QBC38DRAFT_514813 [Podospora fimiseda]|uniref:Uncharacterized protein n=1 Tax=Podospora fimiseda TaxID=252190 RepID=A0AAN7GQD9_9PEZI|nr:hypothetical protein QBC38DRAFT_514813 [Podospora fimiseda]
MEKIISPSQTTTMVSTSSNLHHHRLKLWVYTARRRNNANNRTLAKYIRNKVDLKEWTVAAVDPSKVSIAGANSRDNFIPLQVDFRLSENHNNQVTGADCLADLREIFEDGLVKPVVDSLNFPVPTSTYREEYTGWRFTPFRIRTDRTVTTLFKIIRPALTSPGLAHNLANLFSQGLDTWLRGGPLFAVCDCVENLIEHAQVDGLDAPNLSIHEVLGNAFCRPDGVDLSLQRLSERMIALRNATVFFEAYKDQMAPLCDRISRLKSAGTVLDKNKLLIAGSVFVLAIGAGLFWSGQASGAMDFALDNQLLVGAVGSMMIAAVAKLMDDKNKDQRLITDFRNTVHSLCDALRQANVVATAAFCSQVLHFPLDSKNFLSSEREIIIRELGVDIPMVGDVGCGSEPVNRAPWRDSVPSIKTLRRRENVYRKQLPL